MVMASMDDKFKDIVEDMEHKAYELKGRAKQKKKDIEQEDTM